MTLAIREAYPAAPPSRGGNRRGRPALALQETLTVIVRVRAGTHVGSEADSFRARLLRLLRAGEGDALAAGYARPDVWLALYAVVAFVDECVLNSAGPAFAEWARKPLQDEVFGGHVAGEMFFQHLQDLLARDDSEDAADVLEVYQLCMLLGFGGGDGAGEAGTVHAYVTRAAEKIARVRGSLGELAPEWAPPLTGVREPVRDRWIRPLGYGTAAAVALALLLVGGFHASIRSELDALRAPAATHAHPVTTP